MTSNSDPVAIEAYDYIEIYCECARQTSHYLTHLFGFEPIAYKGPETNCRDSVSYLLKQNDINFIVTSYLSPSSPISSLVLKHGMTVHDIAFEVSDCEIFYNEVLKRGAKSVLAPTTIQDGDFGVIKRAAIATYGDTIHSIIERKNYSGLFAPGFVEYSKYFSLPSELNKGKLLRIDHVVGNVELGKMNEWVKFYEQILGFTQYISFSDEDISTEYSALMSKVMRNGTNKVKMPINEPANGKRKSQIQEYLDFHHGPGVHHIAFLTADIVKTVGELRDHGVSFLNVPKTYYDDLPNRVGSIKEDLQKIAELGILVDRDEEGYLLQIFSKPLQDRPTMFFEVIQREGSQGFGVGNFKALFEAIEREQELRGNL
jgi:4-hydroxyphenylpyruvate dioxygenase